MNEHTPPHDDGAERIVLGAAMLEHRAAQRATELLRPEDFYRPAHTAIFDRIERAILLGEPADPAAIANRLGPSLTRVGGAPYLHELVACVPIAANLAWYAHTVAERSQMRQLIEAGQRIIQIGHDTERGAADAMALAIKYLAAATDGRPSDNDPLSWAEIIHPAMRSIERASKAGATPGLSTGLAMLDKMTGGLRGGQLITIAGRPSMGKSVIAVDWARHAAFGAGKAALVFSLEMSRDEIFNRIISAQADTSLSRITRGQLDDRMWTDIIRVTGETETAPLYIDDSAPLHLHDIIAKSRRQHGRTPLGLIVVDYLQLLTLGRRSDSREREVSEISRSLKLLAKELDVPVIAAAQLNRGPEARADHRPMMSDLRESGSVEQDSDIVILLYREDYYNTKTARQREIDLIVAKHRGGPVGTVVGVTDFAHARINDPNPEAMP